MRRVRLPAHRHGTWLLVPLGVVALSVAFTATANAPQRPAGEAPVAAPDPRLEQDRERALAIRQALQLHFDAGSGRLWETSSSAGDPAYATLWPFSQAAVSELLAAELLSGDPETAPAVAAGLGDRFEGYLDAAATPPGYSASLQPPLGTGDRKFYDDNAWVGLALLQAAQASGSTPALDRARQAFAFVVSGWDDDPSHPAAGGVWWSQTMPNPRYRHRNTVSTAAGAELGLRLYDATGRANPTYLAWSQRMYDWVERTMRGPTGLYGDHVDLNGVVDPSPATYNQGTMIGASLLLYRITGDAVYLGRARSVADTSLAYFEPSDFAQPPAFNAIYFRHLLELEAETHDGRYRDAMQAYADHMWNTAYDPDSGLFTFAYWRYGRTSPYRLVDQAAMLQIYASLAATTQMSPQPLP